MPARIEFTDEQIAEMKRLFDGGIPLKETGERFGRGLQAIRRVVRELKWERRRPHFSTRDVDFDAAVTAYQFGETLGEVAARFGISLVTFRNELLRRQIRPRDRAEAAASRSPVRQSAFSLVPTDPAAQFFVGMLTADGCLHGDSRSLVTLAQREADADVVEAFAAFTNSSMYRRDRKSADGTIVGRIAECRFGSRECYADLERWGCVRGKRFRTAHPLLLESPHYHRGLLAGDGMVRDRSITLVMGCRVVVEAVAVEWQRRFNADVEIVEADVQKENARGRFISGRRVVFKNPWWTLSVSGRDTVARLCEWVFTDPPTVGTRPDGTPLRATMERKQAEAERIVAAYASRSENQAADEMVSACGKT